MQPFIWESSGGHSILNLANVQFTRRLAHGVGGFGFVHVRKSMDNASSLGAGGTVVAQNRQISTPNGRRRTSIGAISSGELLAVELPFGPNRRWLKNGGLLADVLGGWTATVNVTAQSGTPFTARVCGAATDLRPGTNGSLRADYTGAADSAAGNPTVDDVLQRGGVRRSGAGLFGDSARNMIVGPGGAS